MKKAQVSLEYVLLFLFIFAIFIAIASFILIGTSKISPTKELANNLVKKIKTQTITASLSTSEYTSDIIIPYSINSVEIKLEIFGNPDNLLMVRSRLDNQILAKTFLPVIDNVDLQGFENNFVLGITKNETNKITLEKK